MTGQTLLPMPMGTEQIFENSYGDSQLKSNIEEIVIKWAGQINDILSEQSQESPKAQEAPLPSDGKMYFRRGIADKLIRFHLGIIK